VAERPDYYGNPAELRDDIAVVREVFAAFAARDPDRLLPLVADDCELHMEGTRARTGRTQPYRGPAGMREYFADAERVWEELHLHADDFRAVPGAVIVLGHVTGRTAEGPLRRAAVWTWRLRDGRITSVRVADMGELADGL
jgi:ketosteroid isomerase-like protein